MVKRKKKITLNDVWKLFKKTQVIYLATADGKKPRVRPVTMIHYKRKLWVSTSSSDAKVCQIKRNPAIEFCLLLKTNKHSGYVRGSGRALIVKSLSVKKELSEAIPFFKYFWKIYKDPSFCLLQLKLRQIEYMPLGKMSAVRLSV
ncbi:MAG TPA: pyridoxamine 5'-phosphate oxidase family protein [bacterium]